MPIRADLRHHYTGPAWKATRAAILKRARNKCESCTKPNGEFVETHTGRSMALLGKQGLPVMFWRLVSSGSWRDWSGFPVRAERMFGLPTRTVRVVLTVAHLNHTPGDDRDDNLAALCQWCHLHYDHSHHKTTRSTRKDAARPLLAEVSHV